MRIIAGLYRFRELKAPKTDATRPTASRMRESFFNICQGIIEDAVVLDLFAGSGAIGFEALSRGAKSVAFVDESKEAIRCIHDNAKLLGVEKQIQVFHGDVYTMLRYLEKQKRTFTLIYADPPYAKRGDEGSSESSKVIDAIDKSNLLANGGEFFIEEAADYPPVVGDIKTLILKSSRKLGRGLLQQYENV